MRKFLLSFILCFSLLFSLSLAVTIDLSDYGVPDLDTGNTTIYSYQLGFSSGVSDTMAAYCFTSTPMTATASPNKLFVSQDNGSNGYITWYMLSNGSWVLQEEADHGYDNIDDFAGYNEIIIANYTVYDNEDNSVIIYQPSQNEGGENMSQVLTDLTTVMTAVLSNATSLVTWITSNPLVYLWVIMAIIIAIIAFVRGFIRGV